MKTKRSLSKGPLKVAVVRHWPLKGAAEKFYREYVDPIKPQIKAMAERASGGNRTVADEMISEAGLKIISAVREKQKKNEPIKNRTWFALTIARNAIGETVRKEAREQRFFNFKPIEEFAELESREKDPARKKPTLEEIEQEARELLKKVHASPKTKEIFVYHTGLEDGKQKKVKQTARKFGLSEPTTRGRILRMKEKMRKAREK